MCSHHDWNTKHCFAEHHFLMLDNELDQQCSTRNVCKAQLQPQPWLFEQFAICTTLVVHGSQCSDSRFCSNQQRPSCKEYYQYAKQADPLKVAAKLLSSNASVSSQTFLYIWHRYSTCIKQKGGEVVWVWMLCKCFQAISQFRFE